MNLKIREALAGDYAGISGLVLEVHRLHLENRPDVYLDTDTPLSEERFEELLHDENAKIFAAENTESGELLAYCIFEIMVVDDNQIQVPSEFAYVSDFCVKSGYRKNGIGRILFEHMKDYVKSEGISSLQLTAWEFNQSAIQFYESMGMTTRNRTMELQVRGDP